MQRKAKKVKIFRIAMLAFSVYVVVSFSLMQIDISKRKNSLAEIDGEVKNLQLLNEEIERILDAGTDTDYIIRIAREKLGFAFPDEKVFIDPNRKSQ